MKKRRINRLLLLLFLGFSTSHCIQFDKKPPSIVTAPGVDFNAFVNQSFNTFLARDPETVITFGMADTLGAPKDQLTDISDAYLKETQRMQIQTLEQLETYDRENLSPDQRLIFDTYLWYLQDQIEGQKYTYNTYPVTPTVNGVNFSLQYFLTDYAPIQTEEDAQNYIQLLAGVPAKIQQLIDALELRSKKGVILPRFLFDWVIPGIQSIAQGFPGENIYYKAAASKLKGMPGLSEMKKEQLLDQVKNEISRSIQPAYGSLTDALRALSRKAGNTIGVGSLPDGKDYYEYTLSHHTTTSMSIDDIHDTGIQELETIHQRMESIFAFLGYPNHLTLSDYFNRVARDGGDLSGNDIQIEYENIIQNADSLSANFFTLKPRVGVIVRGDPMGGFYMPPSFDGSRPGIFYAQTEGTIPRFMMPDLAYHEAIPGHHYQIALAGELEIPLFQKTIELNGYTEGWALYAERLMWENGAYADDPFGELGYLQMQARRAARLVMDTGIHSKNWTFNQAVSYMIENTGMGENDVAGEVARSIVWPGQECSYYVGYMKILELRQRVQHALGDKFDIKAFHDLILGGGAVPLTVLEQEINDYLAATH
jgi:uncharacterized protein (DUF885 family)